MKLTGPISTLAFVATCISGPSQAQQTWSPAGQTIGLSGNLVVGAQHAYNCSINSTITISADGKSAEAIPNPTPCGVGIIAITDGPFAVEMTSFSSIVFRGIKFTIFHVTCQGDLAGTFDNATGKINFNVATLPSNYLEPCKFLGSLNTSPALSVTIP